MNSHIFLVGFIIYAIAMIWLGWFVSRNQKSGEDFLLGGRSLPLFLTLGSTVATMVGLGSVWGRWALATAMAGPECFMASVEPLVYCWWRGCLHRYVNYVL